MTTQAGTATPAAQRDQTEQPGDRYCSGRQTTTEVCRVGRVP